MKESVFINKEEPKFLPISWLGLIIMAYFSSWYLAKFSGATMAIAGILSSIVYNLVVNPLFFFMLHSRITKLLIFASTNLAFNYFVFMKFGASILGILS